MVISAVPEDIYGNSYRLKMTWNGCVPDPEYTLHDYPLISRLIIVSNIAVVLWGAITTYQFQRMYKLKHLDNEKNDTKQATGDTQETMRPIL